MASNESLPADLTRSATLVLAPLHASRSTGGWREPEASSSLDRIRPRLRSIWNQENPTKWAVTAGNHRPDVSPKPFQTFLWPAFVNAAAYGVDHSLTCSRNHKEQLSASHNQPADDTSIISKQHHHPAKTPTSTRTYNSGLQKYI